MTSSGRGRYSQDVERQTKASLAVEKILAPATGQPALPPSGESNPRLNISVVFTSVASTLLALKEAGDLASNLGARNALIVLQLVPYPLPLEIPPVLIEFNERRFRVIAGQSPVAVEVRIYLCRDRFEALASVLRPSSLVMLGGPKKWWRTAEGRLACKLRKAGYEVILTET